MNPNPDERIFRIFADKTISQCDSRQVLTIANLTVPLTVVATECTIDGPTTIDHTPRSRANNCSLMEIAHLFSIVRFEWHW